MATIQAVCGICKETVDAKTVLSEDKLWEALNKGDEIEAMHLDDNDQHLWNLSGKDKDNLRRARAAGMA